MAIGNFLDCQRGRRWTAVIKDKGVQMVKPDADFEKVATEYKKIERDRNIKTAKSSA